MTRVREHNSVRSTADTVSDFDGKTKRAVQGSTATCDTYAGGGPFLINRKSGRVAMCGSAHPAEYYIEAWQRGQLADLPRPA